MNMNDTNIPAPQRAAYRMLTLYAPACFQPSQEAIDALAGALRSMQDALAEGGYADRVENACVHLLDRIGGYAHLPAYVGALLKRQ